MIEDQAPREYDRGLNTKEGTLSGASSEQNLWCPATEVLAWVNTMERQQKIPLIRVSLGGLYCIAPRCHPNLSTP